MPIITLISDTGSSGYYPAAIKASILAELPSATLIDITHNIKPFHILDAAFILRNVYHSFPAGSVHLVAVDAPGDKHKRFVALYADGHYFVGADNGLFSLALGGKPITAVEISLPDGYRYSSFPAAGVLAKAACSIAGGAPLASIGKEYTALQSLKAMQPTYDANSITAQIIYTDEYGNCFCNLDKILFQQVVGNRPFIIDLKGNVIEAISNGYDDVENGEIVALFSTSGLLELAMTYGNLAQILGLKKDDKIMITAGD